MQRLKTFLKILTGAVNVLLVIFIAGNIYTVLARALTDEEHPKFFGFYSAVVISGSMSGTIEVNDLIICLEKSHYSIGDIVTYESENGSLITHRIVSESDAGFITKGDANNITDLLPVSQSNIVGKVICVIPGVGLIIEFLHTPLGLMCLVSIGILILYLPYAMEHYKNSRNNGGDTPTNGGKNDGSGN